MALRRLGWRIGERRLSRSGGIWVERVWRGRWCVYDVDGSVLLRTSDYRIAQQYLND